MARRLSVLVLACASELPAAPDLTRPSPGDGSHGIPSPPEQAAEWRPPETDLPEVFVSAVWALFDQGLADPRGCEYREIEVTTGSCWTGGGDVARTRGWVWSPEPGGRASQQYAVCWNGLAYPTAAVGERVDWREDVEALLADDRAFVSECLRKHEQRELERREDAVSRGEEYHPSAPHVRWPRAWSESESVSHDSLLPLKAALLLRLGAADLAEQVWSQWFIGNEDEAEEDPYLRLVADWTWALLDRAVCAHMRGDDHLALLSARALLPIRQAAEDAARRRGFVRRGGTGRGEDSGYLAFLAPAEALLADQERRATQRRRARPPQRPRASTKEARIAAWVEALEEVCARQEGQPGGVNLGDDPIVKALISGGEDAVVPLLDCLERDTRLTRSVHFHRDFRRHRSLIGVHEAAYVALCAVLRTSFFDVIWTGDDLSSRGLAGRRKLAASVRRYWTRFRGVPLPERWYQTLADDRLAFRQWLQAASCIVRPVDVNVSPGSMFMTGWVTVPQRKPGAAPAVCGEVLRGKAEPSVAELMARRVAALSMTGEPTSPGDVSRMRGACEMALLLAKWDIESAAPVLRRHSARCEEFLAAGPGRFDSDWDLLPFLPKAAALRAEAGDAEALEEYARWLRGTAPADVARCLEEVAMPLWRYPDSPPLMQTAEWMFNDDASPWAALVGQQAGLREYQVRELFETPLVGVPAFRDHLLRGLADRRGAGSVRARADTSYPGDPLCPGPGARVEYRTCDVYTRLLARQDGTPAIEYYWPLEKRDRTVAACSTFLRQYGERFACTEAQRALWPWPDEPEGRLVFPPLGRTATTHDVARGRAIFSLEGEGQRRLWSMPETPMRAEWPSVNVYPRAVRRHDPETERSRIVVHHDTRGRVWQAEEVLRDGRWRRLFGFVGRYCVAVVPAEEIEFRLPGRWWRPLSRGLDCRLSLADAPDNGRVAASAGTVLGTPLRLTLRLRNRRGVGQAVPSFHWHRDSERRPLLTPGLSIALEAASDPLAGKDATRAALAGVHIPTRPPDWTRVEPDSIPRLAQRGDDRTLAPTEEFEAFTVDLRELYDLARPGLYRVRALFSSDGGGLADGESNAVTFRRSARGAGAPEGR